MSLCYCVHVDGDACGGQMHWIPSGTGSTKCGYQDPNPIKSVHKGVLSSSFTFSFSSSFFSVIFHLFCVCTVFVLQFILLTHNLWWALRSTSNIFDITNNAPQTYLLFFFHIFASLGSIPWVGNSWSTYMCGFYGYSLTSLNRNLPSCPSSEILEALVFTQFSQSRVLISYWTIRQSNKTETI